MVPYFSILLVGGGLFLEARCPISQLTLACLCHLFNRLSLSEWDHKQFDQCNFLLLQTLHTIAILQVFRFLPLPLSVFWEYEIPSFAAFLCILCPIPRPALSVGWNVPGLNFGWTFGAVQLLAEFWVNSIFSAICTERTFFWSKFVVFCVQYVQICVSTYNLVYVHTSLYAVGTI